MPKGRVLLAFVLLAVAVVYTNHFRNSFHFDDFHTITGNPYVRDLANVPRFFTDARTFSIMPANQTYRPLVSTSLAIDYRLGDGYNVFWFHLSTFVIFLVLLAAMYALFRAILGAIRDDPRNEYVALFATAWYGLHPAIAETVNYIIQRGDIYSTLAVVGGLSLYAWYPRVRANGLYLIPVVLGALSKPPTLIFPVLLFLFIWYFEEGLKRERLTATLVRCVPATVVCALMGALQIAMTPRSYSPTSLSAWSYILIQPYVLLRYFVAFFLPLHLSADTDLQPFTGPTAGVFLEFFFVAALVVLIVVTARDKMLRPISFGIAWFLIASLPTSLYPLSEVENDHRMFLPFVGLVLAAAWGIALAVEAYLKRYDSPAAQRAVAAAALVVLCVYGYGTYRRNQVWRTEETLWYDVTRESPHNGRGLMNYGLTQMAKGEYEVAKEYFDRAAIYDPNYPILETNRGIVLAAMHDPEEAEQHFQRAIALAPADASGHFYYGRWLDQAERTQAAIAQLKIAEQLNPVYVEPRSLLLRMYTESGDLADARTEAEGLLRIDPTNADAAAFIKAPPVQDADYWVSVSLLQYQRGQYHESIASGRKALALKPNSVKAYNNIGAAQGQLGLLNAGIDSERQALRIDPRFELARNNERDFERQRAILLRIPERRLVVLSVKFYQRSDYAKSADLARDAILLKPNDASAYNNIAAAEAALGDWDAAIAAGLQAVRLDPRSQLAKNNLAWAEQQKKRAAH